MRISAFLPVLNEEKRISYALNSLVGWCDEIIVLDKGSSDNTKSICKNFGSKVTFYEILDTTDINYEINFFLKNCNTEWFIIFTASDIIHPILAFEIKSIIRDTNFSVISIPFRRYVLGINSKRSPWHSEYNPIVFKKADVIISNSDIHGTISSKGKKIILRNFNKYPMFHLTHATVDILMKRHLRYWEGESKSDDIDLKKSLKDFFKSIFSIIFKKKTFLLGYDGIALIFSFLSYKMMSYVYKWEVKNNKSEDYYNDIRVKINNEWQNTLENK